MFCRLSVSTHRKHFVTGVLAALGQTPTPPPPIPRLWIKAMSSVRVVLFSPCRTAMQVNVISPGDTSSGPNFQTLDAARSLNAPRGGNVPSVEALKGLLQESFKRLCILQTETLVPSLCRLQWSDLICMTALHKSFLPTPTSNSWGIFVLILNVTVQDF